MKPKQVHPPRRAEAPICLSETGRCSVKLGDKPLGKGEEYHVNPLVWGFLILKPIRFGILQPSSIPELLLRM